MDIHSANLDSVSLSLIWPVLVIASAYYDSNAPTIQTCFDYLLTYLLIKVPFVYWYCTGCSSGMNNGVASGLSFSNVRFIKNVSFNGKRLMWCLFAGNDLCLAMHWLAWESEWSSVWWRFGCFLSWTSYQSRPTKQVGSLLCTNCLFIGLLAAWKLSFISRTNIWIVVSGVSPKASNCADSQNSTGLCSELASTGFNICAKITSVVSLIKCELVFHRLESSCLGLDNCRLFSHIALPYDTDILLFFSHSFHLSGNKNLMRVMTYCCGFVVVLLLFYWVWECGLIALCMQG